MSWTCQHDHKGYCKLIKKPCIPGMNGCILKNCDGIVFSDGNHKVSSSEREGSLGYEKENSKIDFSTLVRSN